LENIPLISVHKPNLPKATSKSSAALRVAGKFLEYGDVERSFLLPSKGRRIKDEG
jgi:hypothetical protein